MCHQTDVKLYKNVAKGSRLLFWGQTERRTDTDVVPPMQHFYTQRTKSAL